MNETYFAEIQKENCWFSFSMFEKLPEVDPNQIIKLDPIWLDDVCVQRHIFAMIFGSFGYSVRLAEAKLICREKLLSIGYRDPKSASFDDPEFLKWLNLFAQYNVLYGTILAYQHDYVAAARYLMNGLKTRAINLFLPYCDFIHYVLSKLGSIPVEIAEYDGCGFSVDEPMGGEELNGGFLVPSAAERIIPALEGDNGEVILVHNGRTRYGNLRRYSTKSKNFRNCIDVYETLMVDASLNLKKLRIYFNGYFSAEKRNTIRLPKGFRIDICSMEAKYYKFVE